jgi:tetratricopeptide (TPR) repeat protein
MSCVAQRLRAVLHIVAAAARFTLGGYCLVVAGQVLGLKGQAAPAFQALQKAARLGTGNAEAQYQLGVVLFRRQLHAEAVRQFEKAVALRPTDARARDYLALGYEALGEAVQADEAYRGALRVNDDGPFFDSLLDYNYGRFLLKERRLEESRSHLDRALVLLPRSRGVRYERGKLNLTLGQYQAAREDAERALSLPDPGGSVLDLQVYYLLATVYARLGEKDLARKYAELSRTTRIPDQDCKGPEGTRPPGLRTTLRRECRPTGRPRTGSEGPRGTGGPAGCS